MSISSVVFLIVSVSNDTDRDLDFTELEVLDHLDFFCYKVRDFSVPDLFVYTVQLVDVVSRVISNHDFAVSSGSCDNACADSNRDIAG